MMLRPDEIVAAARLGHELRTDDVGLVSCSCGWPGEVRYSASAMTIEPAVDLERVGLVTLDDFDVHARARIERAFPEGDMRGSTAVWLIFGLMFFAGLAVGLAVGLTL